MSFDNQFKARWEEVIKPGIQRVVIGGKRLEPIRVDARTVSDSILTEILQGISPSLLVFVDITSIGIVDGRPARNANVLYELGLAHATRLPEEVLVFRSDNDDILFDVANIRINSYEPETSITKSVEKVSNSIVSAFKEINLQKSIALQHAADLLDFDAVMELSEASNRPLRHPEVYGKWTQEKQVTKNAIQRLLEIGAIQAVYNKVKKEGDGSVIATEEYLETSHTYAITEFGKALSFEVAKRYGWMEEHDAGK